MYLTAWFLLSLIGYQTANFLPAQICCVDKIKLISAQQNDAKLSMSRLPIKIVRIYNIGGLDVMFEVEYLWNDGSKKDGVNANPV